MCVRRTKKLGEVEITGRKKQNSASSAMFAAMNSKKNFAKIT